MQKSIFLLLGCSLSLLSCSTEDSTTTLSTSESDISTEGTTLSTNSVTTMSDFLRFEVARRSKACREGLGICTMQDKRDAIEEEQRRKKELEDLAQNDVGLYQSNSIEAPIDPTDDFEGGIMDVIYDKADLLATGQLQLDIKLAQAPTSTPVPLKVEETLSITIDGIVFSLSAGDYNYNPSLGTYGGYTIIISN